VRFAHRDPAHSSIFLVLRSAISTSPPSSTAMLGLYPPSAFDAYKKDKTRFSASVDAVVEQIHAACDGVGTDDKALVKLIGPLTANDRGLVSLRYKELHGQTLRELVKSETSGSFGYLLQLICFSLPQAEAYILFHAMKGAGTSDHLLYSVLMGRTNDEIGLVKKAFFDMYDTDLSVAISGEVSGEFLAVLTKALQVGNVLLPTTKATSQLTDLYLFVPTTAGADGRLQAFVPLQGEGCRRR
jgi:hypothetical protein